MRGCAGLAITLWACLCHAHEVKADDTLVHLRSITIEGGIGGLSAIETRDGRAFVTLSDRGQAYDLTLERTSTEVEVSPRTQPAAQRDSEGLAFAGATLFFSYEDPADVRADNGTVLPRDPAFDLYEKNAGFEALAGAPDGTLYAIPERSGGSTQPFPVHRFRDGAWDTARMVPRRGAFLPVGADIGPDGRLYLLERAFSPLGFRSRIRRFDPDEPNGDIDTLLTTRLGLHDNLEGLAVWTAPSGATCVTMVSDDNFLPIQRSEIVEYVLQSPLAAQNRCD